MAGITIKRVEVASSQPYGADISSFVVVNNNNMIATKWDDEYCDTNEQYGTKDRGGHKGQLNVEVISSKGDVIQTSGWVTFCAPIEDIWSPDPRIPVSIDPPEEPGLYTIRATVRDNIGNGHQDTKEVSVNVKTPDGYEPGSDAGDKDYYDDGNGGGWWYDPVTGEVREPPKEPDGRKGLLQLAIENPVTVGALGIGGIIVLREGTETLLGGE